MAKQGFFFTQLTPAQTLHILAELGTNALLLHKMGTGFVVNNKNNVEFFFDLIVPVFSVPKREKRNSPTEQEKVLNSLGIIFNQITKGRIHEQHNIQPNLLPLADTAIWCL